MGALEDDLDYGLKLLRQLNRESHTMLDANADWDELQCTRCNRRGGVDLSFNVCKPVGATVHEVGCNCGFCKMGFTKA